MMDCAQYRRAILAEPHDANPQLRAHRDSCRDCLEYTNRLLRFEGRLERAMRVRHFLPAPRGRSCRFRPHARLARRQLQPPRLAGDGRQRADPGRGRGRLVAGGTRIPALAADVVAHMAGEPQAWARTDIPVSPPELAQALADARVQLDPKAGMVSYARSCLFRAHHVPHLVVQTEMGPVTVMVLAHESVSRPERFDEQGYHGVILPVAGHGSLAVLARGQNPDPGMLKQIAARVQDALIWTG